MKRCAWKNWSTHDPIKEEENLFEIFCLKFYELQDHGIFM